MKDEKSTTKEDDMEIVEIAEFKRSDTHRRISKQEIQERERRQRFYGILALLAAGFFAAMLLGVFVFHDPEALLCIVLVLEAVIAVCLYDLNIWVHVLEVIIGIMAGVLFDRLSLMILGVAEYLGVILVLYGMKNRNTGTGSDE